MSRYVLRWSWWARPLLWLATPVGWVSRRLACVLIDLALHRGTRLVSMPPLRLDHGWTEEDTDALLACPPEAPPPEFTIRRHVDPNLN